MSPPGALICLTELRRPGTVQDLPTHWPGTHVWTRVCGGKAPYAVEGRNFHGPQRDAAWLFLTVFTALTGFPHGVFLSSSMYRIRRQPPVDGKLLMQLLYHGELPTPPHLCFIVSLPWVQLPSLCAVRISLNSAIFLYTAGPATFRPLIAALDSSCFLQGGGYFIELCNASCVYALQRINYFHPGANAVLSHGSRDS